MKIRHFAVGIALTVVPAATASAQVVPCWADITHDMSVNVVDLLEVITHWGPCVGAPPAGPNSPGSEDGSPPPVVYCAADIAPPADPDGVIDVNDLLMVITSWGPCATPPPSQGDGYVVWCEDWSTASYARWTSAYNNDTNPCTVAGFNSTNVLSP